MRRKICALILTIIGAILLMVSTNKFIPQLSNISIFIMYLPFTCLIFVSGLDIIKDRKSKESWCGLLVGIDATIMIIDLAFGCNVKTDKPTSTIVFIIFIITFLLFIVLCALWNKAEKNK